MPRRLRLLAFALSISAAGVATGAGVETALALLSDQETIASTFGTAISFDTLAPNVERTVGSKTAPYLAGYIRQGGPYYVYANVTDGGSPASGVASVTADVSSITSGQTAVMLSSGAYSSEGVSYNFRSAALTANASLTHGAAGYSLTARDVAGNSRTASGYSMTVDNTAPAPSDVQTANAGATAGRAETGDTITFTFSEPIEPHSILAGWTGAATTVVVRLADGGAGGDTLTVWNAANTAALPLGSVNLKSNYTGAGASFTGSSMVRSGSAVTITLGAAGGDIKTATGQGANMVWTSSSSATDRAGNACVVANVTETGASDKEF
ncbi:hypothetical protein BH20CHL6_BH20CHL6_03090 [soil metagenome]